MALDILSRQPVGRVFRPTPPPVIVKSPPSAKPTDEFGAWLERGHREVFTVNTTLTPERAQRLLDANPDNRKAVQEGYGASVETYAAAMKRGEWTLNGETIVLSKEGYLNDGQHRCLAVVMSGCTIPALLTFGVDRDSRHTIDQGIKRTHGAILTMHGEKNGNDLAAASRFIFNYQSERGFRNQLTTTQVMQVVREHPALAAALNEARALCGSYHVSNGVVGAAYYICACADTELARQFLELSTKGLGLNRENHPAFRLRQAYQAHLGASAGKRLHVIAQAALFIKAFNLFAKGKSPRALKWAFGDAFPVAGE